MDLGTLLAGGAAVGVIPVAVRERIIHLYGQGRTTRQIAEAVGYCTAAIRRVRQHLR